MKTLYLLFGFALMGVLFFACQKDEPVVEEVAVNETEMLSVERSYVKICCEADPAICVPCDNDGACCCHIIFSFAGSATDYLSKYKYCKAWDTSSTCEVPAVSGTSCNNTWDGVDGDVCVGDNYWCIPRNTGFSIFNTSHIATMEIRVICGTNPQILFTIAPRTTEVVSLNNFCAPDHCE